MRSFHIAPAAFLTLLMLLSPGATLAWAADDYQLGPDSQVQEGVPEGTLTTHTWKSEKTFPGTVREYSIYVPKQYDAAKPACVMVFQDGGSYSKKDGQFRATIV